MKKQIFLSVLFACIAMSAFAKIIRVNNNPGQCTGVNCYTTLTAAVAAAVDDDVIYVEPSATPYDEGAGMITITKRLKIIGNGAYLDSHSGLQNKANSSTFSAYTLNIPLLGKKIGIWFHPSSSGSVIYGLTITNTIFIEANNITIQRCVVMGTVLVHGYNDYPSYQNLTLIENKLHQVFIALSINNLIIKNNIIFNSDSYNSIDIRGSALVGPPNSIDVSGVIENNNILTNASASLYVSNGAGGSLIFINNIFGYTGSSDISLNGSGTTAFYNNFCSCNTLPSGNGNQNLLDLQNVLVNPTITTDSDAQLKAGSPAINAGWYGSGDDIGAFNDGTNRPSFKLGLIPPYPTIYSITVPATVTTSTMNVTLSTRSNN